MGILFEHERFMEKCTFCGQRATAYWSCNEIIGCCGSCAQSVLPAFAADALLGKHAVQHHALTRLQAQWKEMDAVFWRAACLAVRRVLQVKRDSESGIEF